MGFSELFSIFCRITVVLTHDGILIRGACIIGEADVVADSSTTDNRMRALDFVGRLRV